MGAELGTAVEAYIFGNQRLSEEDFLNIAIEGAVASIPSTYMEKAVDKADESDSVARKIMKDNYDESFGKMLKYFFDGIMAAVGAT